MFHNLPSGLWFQFLCYCSHRDNQEVVMEERYEQGTTEFYQELERLFYEE
jgi:hypothetical protein